MHSFKASISSKGTDSKFLTVAFTFLQVITMKTPIYEELSPLPPGFANKRNCCYANCIFQCLMNITPICELCRCLEAAHTSCTECMQANCYRAILYSFIIIALDKLTFTVLYAIQSFIIIFFFTHSIHLGTFPYTSIHNLY